MLLPLWVRGKGNQRESIYPNKALLEAFETHGDALVVETVYGSSEGSGKSGGDREQVARAKHRRSGRRTEALASWVGG